MKWEYKKLLSPTEDTWKEVLKLGKDGWEMVAVRDTYGSPVFYFKRLIDAK